MEFCDEYDDGHYAIERQMRALDNNLVEEYKAEGKETPVDILSYHRYRGVVEIFMSGLLVLTGPRRGEVWCRQDVMYVGIGPWTVNNSDDGHCADFIDMILYFVTNKEL